MTQILVVQANADPWHYPAVERLKHSHPGAESYLSGGGVEDGELEEAIEFALALERVIRTWERELVGRPRIDGGDRHHAKMVRMFEYRALFSRVCWAVASSKRGGAVVIGSTSERGLENGAKLFGANVRTHIDPTEAFELAYADGSVWWFF